MLESAEIGHKISKQVYVRKEPPLRKALLNAQFDLSQTRRGPVLIILSGVHAGGRGETANKLNEWMDPRHIRVIAFGPRTPEEAQRPPAWRYWRALPPKGAAAIAGERRRGRNPRPATERLQARRYVRPCVPHRPATAALIGSTHWTDRRRPARSAKAHTRETRNRKDRTEPCDHESRCARRGRSMWRWTRRSTARWHTSSWPSPPSRCSPPGRSSWFAESGRPETRGGSRET